MKTFIANVEERYYWDCPYCGEVCEVEHNDPDEEESVTCEHCGKKARCEGTER